MLFQIIGGWVGAGIRLILPGRPKPKATLTLIIPTAVLTPHNKPTATITEIT